MSERNGHDDAERKQVYSYKKKGRTFWSFKTKDPTTRRWETVSLTKKLATRYGVEPSGSTGSFLRMDALKVRWLFEQELAEQVRRGEHRPRTARTRGSGVCTLREMFDRYVEAKCQKNTEETRHNKRRIFDEFVGLVGDIPAQDVDDAHASEIHARFREQQTRSGMPLSTTTVRDYLSVLRTAFRWAQKAGRVKLNPFELIDLPERADPTTRYWTPGEIATQLETHFAGPDSDFRRWIVLGAFSMGLSPIEWEGADWRDFDPENETLFIDKVKKQAGKARRSQHPIPSLFMPAFKARANESGPIWPRAKGKRYDENARDFLRKYMADRWTGFDFLGLRLSYNVFLQNHVQDAVLRDRLLRHGSGRGDLACMARHYSRYELEAMKKAVDSAFAGLGDLAALAMPAGDGGVIRFPGARDSAGASETA